MQHESLAAARVRWLGICTSELAELGICKDALIPITKHDEKKALSMLRRSGLPKKWRKELQYMLFNRRKAEIEILPNVQRKAAASGFDYDLERRSGDMTDPLDNLHFTSFQTSEPQCLTAYLTDKITTIVDSYAAK
ncbi:hypothetical protein DAEQUDRAFT_724826 [Daedalea quercina L-15889]|uniref:Topoisomerase 6 subunit A/Spo11 TOPRIM domain-containing protein n=1 Tax=Daedalea quercina L-15889 TaxID=1314783 RepID=A0A165RR36_9APHY|nr:hypothetical protein DAEQUDRAFT_724826 [Daedalea quercina L-15889]